MHFIFLALATLATASSDVKGPLTDDFPAWLAQHGYDSYDFVRADYETQGSYGGKTANAPKAVNPPVVFIHGNSDAALHRSSSVTGWSNSIQYFLEQGYTTAELHATSWQDTNAINAQTRTRDCKYLVRLRKFLEAVLAYTGAPKISVVGHSMGVTFTRGIIKGGSHSAKDGKCDLGAPLNKKVEHGNSCGLNTLDCGLNPLPWPCSGVAYSSYFIKLNADKTAEGDNVFSMWSLADNLILYETMVWGRSTCHIPTSTGKIVYPAYTHMQTKEFTFKDQYQMIKFHTIP
ncbi:Protein CBG01267 [Caenorhabditis briggsae]|uniref:Protein CBG01267 n=1 Tax=Caenorhabditis briggsae TaxID=6238 RepID=A8WPZ9_CAEBR|nr:Protein CBG01267 [Caenorhabditis briggsae]CAP22557.2 Protein CBG01267 [Caenorhabditis briggsae]